MSTTTTTTAWRKVLGTFAIVAVLLMSWFAVAASAAEPESTGPDEAPDTRDGAPDTHRQSAYEKCLEAVRAAVGEATFAANAGSTASTVPEPSYDFTEELYGYLCEGVEDGDGGERAGPYALRIVDDGDGYGDAEASSISNVSAGPATPPPTDPPAGAGTGKGDRGTDPGSAS